MDKLILEKWVSEELLFEYKKSKDEAEKIKKIQMNKQMQKYQCLQDA